MLQSILPHVLEIAGILALYLLTILFAGSYKTPEKVEIWGVKTLAISGAIFGFSMLTYMLELWTLSPATRVFWGFGFVFFTLAFLNFILELNRRTKNHA